MSVEVKNLTLENHEILALRKEYERKGLGDLNKNGLLRDPLDELHFKLYSLVSQPVLDKALDAKAAGR